MMQGRTHITMRRGAGLIGAAVALTLIAGCEAEEKRIYHDGIYFRTKTDPIDKKRTLADFTVTVKDATQSLDAARKAGAYEGTKYCIDKYGNSRIDWVVGPDAEQLTVSDGDVQFRGTCQRP